MPVAMDRLFDDCVRFHGHRCPGLAIGYRMAVAARDALGAGRADDEQLVAVVENDACGVDALQVVMGCTFGKGNLIFRDVGKSVYTVFSRGSGNGVRISFHGRGISGKADASRRDRIDEILNAPRDDLMTIQPVAGPPPPLARIHGSVRCPRCGETVMETRVRSIEGQTLCIPCSQEPQQGLIRDVGAGDGLE